MRRGLVLLVAFGACGGEVATSGDAGLDAVTDAPLDVSAGPGQPPPEPQTDTTPPTTNIYTFAMNEFFFGDAPRDGSSPSATAWQTFGYNLDGKVTTASSIDVCTLYNGAPTTNQNDGLNGIDNAWGAVLVPLAQTTSGMMNFSQTLTAAIQKGTWTFQFQVVGLSDDPTQSSTGLHAQMFLSGTYGATAPAFDTTTDWPVLSSSLVDGQTIAGGAKRVFPNAYVNNGVFVSGKAADLMEVDIHFQGSDLPLLLHDAFFTFVHSDRGDAINGVIAGILDVKQFCDEYTVIAGHISPSLCSGSTLEGLLNNFRRAADILDDGSDPANVPCSGISVGFGFNAKLVANPTHVVQVPPPPPDPCAD